MEFSVDMVRLETTAEFVDFERFGNKYFNDNPSVSYYKKSSIHEYLHNFKINEPCYLDYPEEFGSMPYNNFYVAFQHNGEMRSKYKFKLVVEFNPNKCDVNVGLLNKILKRYFNNASTVYVKSCDVCCDLYNISMDSVTYDRGRKRTEIDYQSSKGHTHYIGDRGSNGQVKVYDKAAERGLSGTVWTRWEVTLKLDFSIAQIFAGLMDIDVNLPCIYFGTGDFPDDIDVKMKCAIYGIKEGIVSLSDFDYRYRKKITPYFESMAQVKIDNGNVDDLHKTIIDYFRNFVKALFPKSYVAIDNKIDTMQERIEKILNQPFKIDKPEFEQVVIKNDSTTELEQ